MDFIPLRIIATILALIGTYIFLSGSEVPDANLTEQEQRLIPIIRYAVLIARAFEVATFWVL